MNANSSSLRDNPFSKYIIEMHTHISLEAVRLGDMAPCMEFTKLVENFYFVAGKLGTIEHEIALHKMNEEFKGALGDASDAWHRIWTHFHQQRDSERTLKKISRQASQEAVTKIREVQVIYDELPDETDAEIRSMIRASLEAMDKAAKDTLIEIGGEKTSTSWLLLISDLNSYSIYVRYFFAKVAFFVFRHSFIFVFSIALFGITYSELAKDAIYFLKLSFPNWPWLAAVLTLLTYYLKKYILDPKIKKIQTRLEAARLRKLTFNILTVRAMALYSRTLRRGRSA